MKQVFDFQEPYYNLRSETSQFRRENIKTTHYGIQSVKFLGPKIWVMVPQNIKNCKSLSDLSMETQSLPLQNVQKVRCKYWFHLIKFD